MVVDIRVGTGCGLKTQGLQGILTLTEFRHLNVYEFDGLYS
jgi:hypothetical protein